MDPEQAKNLVKQRTHLIRRWVCERCRDDKQLIPLALLYVNQRLSEQDWQQVRQYDAKQPFEEFIRELTEDALKAFLHGVWFGKCAQTIYYWLKHYDVSDQEERQDAEDYIKNKLVENNFARFRSHEQKGAAFPTYISKIIRNLLIDYLNRELPKTQKRVRIESDESLGNNMADNAMDPHKQQHLEEIGQWFFANPSPPKNNKATAHSPDMSGAIKLSPRERLFLRAIYKDEMTIAEAGRLPGINMGRWQAHGYHHRLKKRIKKLLHEMGYENIQSLLYPN